MGCFIYLTLITVLCDEYHPYLTDKNIIFIVRSIWLSTCSYSNSVMSMWCHRQCGPPVRRQKIQLSKFKAQAGFIKWLINWASLLVQLVKNLPAMRETWVCSLGWEDPLEKGKATHSSILAWRIPWTTQTKGSQRVWHDWATLTFTYHP